MKAIDVSYCQTNVNYKKVKQSGVEAVIIRIGYGREISQKDSEFETHYKNARAAGLKVGGYWYSYADSVADAMKEAKACLACINGKKFDLPVYYDMEDRSQIGFGKAKLTEMATTFCDKLEASGYKAGVYANLNWFTNHLDYKELSSKYSIWLAQWSSSHSTKCDVWQYSDRGIVPGINSRVDMNVIENHGIVGQTENKKPAKAEKPKVFYRAKVDGVWLPEVEDLKDYAGISKRPITDIAIGVSEGTIKYRVQTASGRWLPYVTQYNVNDSINGYAGDGTPIIKIKVYYSTPRSVCERLGKYLKAKYRVAPLGMSYYNWQYDEETSIGQDGYAGANKQIDRFQITLS